VYQQTISTLPDNFKEANKCADIHFAPDGKYLCASNRGHNSIVIFRLDSLTQIPNLIGWQTNNINNPQNKLFLYNLYFFFFFIILLTIIIIIFSH